jgi:Cu(I)/Ag(I) efflux system membrane fusion protein
MMAADSSRFLGVFAMSLSRFMLAPLSLAWFLVTLTGCTSSTEAPPATPQTSATESTADPAIETELARLPADEQAAARAQKMCPVSDHPLGSMGAPLKVAVNGRDVFICCEGCKGELEKDPDGYLAKLNK